MKMAMQAAVVMMLALAVSGSAAALTDVEGAGTSGANDSLATSQNAGAALPGGQISIDGWVDVNNENDVDFYSFTLPGALTLYFDIDFADDIGAVSDDDLGLDAEIWVFDATGTLVALNDDSDFFGIGGSNAGTDPGSDRYGDRDPFVGPLTLAAGTYYVVVGHYGNDSEAESQPGYFSSNLAISGEVVTGTTPDATFTNAADCDDPADPAEQCTGTYRLLIRDRFNEAPVSRAPTVGVAGLLLLGLCLLLVGVGALRGGVGTAADPA